MHVYSKHVSNTELSHRRLCTNIQHVMPSKFIIICILRVTFCDTQMCDRCLANMTAVVKVVIHCVFCTIISEISYNDA